MIIPHRRFVSSCWTRREWLAQSSAAVIAVAYPALWSRPMEFQRRRAVTPEVATRVGAQAAPLDPGPLEALAKQGVEAAHAAGARYADARLTREVQHRYVFTGNNPQGHFGMDVETVGLGLRVLVDGYWGYSASSLLQPTEVVRLAREAVAQARVNAKGTPRTVELGQYPVVTGRWSTPVLIDPFTVTIEEKQDYIEYWQACAARVGLTIDGTRSYIHLARQERVVATSGGSCITQTVYESGGRIDVDNSGLFRVQGIDECGKGWELFLEANIPEQLKVMPEVISAMGAMGNQAAPIGRYTLVCDGATMASLVEQTVGLATQLDRALGYEANGEGTSFLDDPLEMLGHFQMAAAPVTITANRSTPTQLATVKWDDEGVEPREGTLVKDGVLTDFQTTREQAAWLAPYYAKAGQPVRSHGYAAAESALTITMQHMPNLALKPTVSATSVDDMVATVTNGILIVKGEVQADHQARNGILRTGLSRDGYMRKITNGRLGKRLSGGAVQFNTVDMWRHVMTVGGPATQATIASPALNLERALHEKFEFHKGKGQPLQLASHSVSGAAALIANQPVVDISRRA